MINKTIKKIMLPVGILLATYILAQIILNNPPKAPRGKGVANALISVETLTLLPQSYQVTIASFGTVKPRTESVLTAQVSGEITLVSQQFRDGGFFEKGDVLVQLDDRDHQAEVKIKQASLLSAQQGLMEEKARSEQALIDWQRLGNGANANSLVLREPQLAAAQAQVLSAQAAFKKAQLLLERTKIIAPYAGRILHKNVDLGSVVANNTQLADIYAIDFVEIRLPINNKDLAFMILPEQYRHHDNATSGAQVMLTSNLIGEQRWLGEIVRTEGAIDENSQQLYIVAQIDDPYASNNQAVAPVKIGQYVNAKITGKTLEQALVIPNSAIYQGSYVYVVEQVENKRIIKRKNVNIVWQNSDEAIVSVMQAESLSFGDNLVTTSLGQVSSGTEVNLISTPLSERVKHLPGKLDRNKEKNRSAKQAPEMRK